MKKIFFLALLLMAVLPSAFAADPITDKVYAIAHYAEQYEMGQITYSELRVYSSSIRDDVRELMAEVVFEQKEGGMQKGVSAESAEKFFGKPTEYTDWVWVANEEREESIGKKVPRWEKVVYDGKKIQVTFNAWPQIYRTEEGDKELYWVDFKIKFKKQFDLDIPAMQSELKGLAQQYISAKDNAQQLAEKLVEFSNKVQGYIQQNSENCKMMLSKFFSSDDKSQEMEFLSWESTIYDGKSFKLMARTRICESCEWVWADTWFEPRFEGHGFGIKMDNAFESSEGYNPESLKEKDNSELFAMLKQELEKARQIAEDVENKKSGFNIGEVSANVQAIHKAISEKANWDETHRVENKQNYIYGIDSLLSAFSTEKTKGRELRYEDRFFENFIEKKEKHCRQVQEEECALDEGCIGGKCRIAIGGNEDCRNNADDDGDTLIDCRDPDCARSCGKLCKGVCESECWPCMQQCNPVCKECDDCRNKGEGGEQCNDICSKECDSCRNEKCWDTSDCTECRVCEEANRELKPEECDMACGPCNECTKADANATCEEECKPCAECKSPAMNAECVDKCKKITQGYMGMFESCEDMCKKGVIFYCSGSKQYSPCDDTTYICNGNMQPIPCELFTCRNEGGTERVQTVACGEEAFCGENQIAEGEQCKCRAGFFDCDKDGKSCESESPCGLEQETCNDKTDNDNDYLVDCDDRMDCKMGMLCDTGKLCFDGACVLIEEANVSAKCPEGMEYKDGQCKCIEGYKEWEGKCVPPEINATCGENFITLIGACVPKQTKCPEGFELKEEACVQKELPVEPNVTECPEGYGMKEGVCIAIITECPSGYVLKEGNCVAEQAPVCPEAYELKQGQCVFVGDIIECAENEILEAGKCVSKELFDDVVVRPDETGKQCVLAEDCGSERAVCSNGFCKEIPQDIYDREYGMEQVSAPEEQPEETEEMHGEQKDKEAAIQEQEADERSEEESKEQPQAQAPAEGITGGFFKWATGFASKEKQCSSDEDCNQNQRCDNVMGRCHCDGGWSDCNGRGDGQDDDGCESEDPTCGGQREICGGGCKENQYCNQTRGNCECASGFNDCDGNWMNGCESQTRCEQCTSDDECSAPVCADWDNVLLKFGCVEGEGWQEENAVVAFSGGCNFHPTGRVDSYLNFDAWGKGMQEIEGMRKKLEGMSQKSWCEFERESMLKERKELEEGLNQQFLEWFFGKYLPSEPDKWESRISGIFDTYWTLVDNARETARTSVCMGEEFPVNALIDIEYESEFGKVHIWEEWKSVEEFGGMNVLTPYMEIWIFPSKDVFKQMLAKAKEGGFMPGPPEERLKEVGPSPKEKEEIKSHPEALKEIEELAADFGGSLDGIVALKDGEEDVFLFKATVNPDVIFKGEPVKTIDFEPDIRVEVQLDFMYDIVKKTEQHGEIQSPPWDRSRRVRKALGNAVDQGMIFAKVTGGFATGDIKVKPLSAVPKLIKIIKLASQGEGPGEGTGEGAGESKEGEGRE